MQPRYYNENTLGPTETIKQVFENQEYLPSWFNVVPEKLKVIVDIGAMIGSFSLWAIQKFPKSTIYCYEPDPESFEFLKKNIAVYNLGDKIKSANLAVWNKEGTSNFYRYKSTPSCNSIIYDKAPGTIDKAVSVQIRTKPMSEIIREVGSIDFLKIDCEGSEYDILYSLSKSELKKIQYIALEYHEFKEDPKKNSKNLLLFLREGGFAAQKVPTDIRKDRQVGYIYAARIGRIASTLNFIFEGETRLIEKYLEMPAMLQEKLVSLEQEFDERSKWALELDNKLKENNTIILKLQKELDERSEWAVELDKAVKEKENLIKLQTEQLQSKDSEINKIKDKNKDLLITISNKDFELTTIKNSFIFKQMQKIARFIDRVAPYNTTRRELSRLGFESIKIIRNQGFFFFLKATRAKLRSISFLSRLKYKAKKHSVPKLYLETTEIKKTKNDSNIISCTNKQEVDKKLRSYLQVGSYDITNLQRKPLISIIIPTLNAVDLLQSNIESIESLTTYSNYEIIIVTNNLNPDSEIRKFLKTLKYPVYLFTDTYSFASINNFAASKAKGEFLLFLNDDIRISAKNWLESFVKLGLEEDVGAIGAKLLLPNGKLQEAGGIIWKNGFGWNYGRNKDPKDPRYNFVRDVDYCSGSCLFVKKKIFDLVSGFDTRYKVAYCEDSDLCLSIKKSGFRVLYQPLAEVIHYEGSTQGTDVAKGIKSYQITNQEIFYDKWKSELIHHMDDSKENSFLESNRKDGIHILYIDHYVPEFDKDAGSLTTYYVLSMLSYMGHKVTFWPDNLHKNEPYVTELQQKGIEVIYGPNNFESFIKERSFNFHLCIMSRTHIAPKYIDTMKKYAPDCKIIYETIDLSFVREFREAELEKNEAKFEQAQKTKERELSIINMSDIVSVKSENEAHLLLKDNPNLTIAVIPPFQIPQDDVPLYDDRKDMLFVGGFQHPPNVDSITYLVNDIFPKIKEKLPDVKLYVIGSNAPLKIMDLCTKTKDVIFLGYVKEMDDYLKNCRILLAPLRYGAGVKGKITQSMAYGLPVVTTPIGAEGISHDDGKILLIAEDTSSFSKKAVELYTNKTLWQKLSVNSKKFVESSFSPEQVKETLSQVIAMCINNKH